MDCNIFVIKKDDQDSMFWSNLEIRNKFSAFSTIEIVNKYKGFEGELLAYFNNFEVFEKNKFAWKSSETDPIIINVSVDEINCNNENFIFVGYDYGLCGIDCTLYSSIYNEILFGGIPELVIFKQKLNENFLFDNRLLAEDYSIVHHKLLLQGKDVEWDEEMKIYKIWKIIIY